jgi:hypothetical protein
MIGVKRPPRRTEALEETQPIISGSLDVYSSEADPFFQHVDPPWASGVHSACSVMLTPLAGGLRIDMLFQRTAVKYNSINYIYLIFNMIQIAATLTC